MKLICVIFIFGLFVNSSFGAKNNMEKLKWFKKSNCEKLQIIKYKSASDHKIEKQITITDAAYINSFQNQIAGLPVSGEMMIDMGPDADHLELEFICNNEKEIVEFYNSKIKTPDTSFYMKSDSADKMIWEEIQSHLKNPEINQELPLVKNLVYSYGDFTIEYLGSEDRTPKGTTASSYVASFKVVRRNDKSEQMIEVRSGQLPPSPQKFKVGSDNLVLNTFKGKDGSKLKSRMFIIYRD